MQNYNEIFEKNVEQFSDAQKKLTAQANNVFQTALASATKLFELQAATAQDSLQRKFELLEEAKDVRKSEDIVDLHKKFCQAEVDLLLGQSKKISDVFFQTQEQLEKLALDNMTEVQDSVNQAIDRGFKSINGAAANPAAVFLKQGIDAQRQAFEQVCGLMQQNWKQNFSQVREATERTVEQVQKVQSAVGKAAGTKGTRGRKA